MLAIESYPVAVALCFLTMLCWGSWANTQKLASREWRFPLFYWDYAFGVLAVSVLLALTMGSVGADGRSFLADLRQARVQPLGLALLGGAIFNFSNIVLVGAVDVAGLAVAFPLAIGLALIIATITNYLAHPVGNPVLLFCGVASVILALGADVLAYSRLPARDARTPVKGLVLSVVAGVSMGFFYRFVASSIAPDFVHPELGLLTPYTAVVVFAVGLVASNVVFNTAVMARPFVGDAIPLADYVRKGSPGLHAIGLLGGAVWGLGMVLSIVSAGAAGYAISYGLGAQGGTMVAALWGIFVWNEFEQAPTGTNRLLALMFASYVLGLVLVVLAR